MNMYEKYGIKDTETQQGYMDKLDELKKEYGKHVAEIILADDTPKEIRKFLMLYAEDTGYQVSSAIIHKIMELEKHTTTDDKKKIEPKTVRDNGSYTVNEMIKKNSG